MSQASEIKNANDKIYEILKPFFRENEKSATGLKAHRGLYLAARDCEDTDVETYFAELWRCMSKVDWIEMDALGKALDSDPGLSQQQFDNYWNCVDERKTVFEALFAKLPPSPRETPANRGPVPDFSSRNDYKWAMDETEKEDPNIRRSRPVRQYNPRNLFDQAEGLYPPARPPLGTKPVGTSPQAGSSSGAPDLYAIKAEQDRRHGISPRNASTQTSPRNASTQTSPRNASTQTSPRNASTPTETPQDVTPSVPKGAPPLKPYKR